MGVLYTGCGMLILPECLSMHLSCSRAWHEQALEQGRASAQKPPLAQRGLCRVRSDTLVQTSLIRAHALIYFDRLTCPGVRKQLVAKGQSLTELAKHNRQGCSLQLA